jgi:hypothetical protein
MPYACMVLRTGGLAVLVYGTTFVRASHGFANELCIFIFTKKNLILASQFYHTVGDNIFSPPHIDLRVDKFHLLPNKKCKTVGVALGPLPRSMMSGPTSQFMLMNATTQCTLLPLNIRVYAPCTCFL